MYVYNGALFVMCLLSAPCIHKALRFNYGLRLITSLERYHIRYDQISSI